MNENTLQYILSSGCYHFFFCDGYRVEVKLHFNPSSINQKGEMNSDCIMYMKQVIFLLK